MLSCVIKKIDRVALDSTLNFLAEPTVVWSLRNFKVRMFTVYIIRRGTRKIFSSILHFGRHGLSLQKGSCVLAE